MQRPDATLVTGYERWKSMGRQVKKGEKAIRIIAPAPVKENRQQKKLDEENKPVLDENGDPEIEEVEAIVQKYKVTNVFDISQTEGDPIETLDAVELTAGVENYAEFLQAVGKVAPVPIRFDELTGQTKGYFHTVKQEIVIQKGMAESQTLKTAIHETAHSLLHNKEKMAEQEDLKNRQTKEVEAESVAFVVCSAFGLNTSEYSFPYIAGWSSGKEMTELKASMDVIRKTSSNLINSIEKEVQHLLTEKEKQKFLDAHANDTISFYVADDMDYPISGDFWEYQTLEEAWDFYQKHPGDAVHGLRGIGFQLQDGSDYIGMEPVIKDGMVLIEEIDHKADATDKNAIMNFIEYVSGKNKNKNIDYSYNLSDASLFHLQMLLDEQLLDAKFSVKGRQDEMVDLQSKLDQIDSYLSVDIDEKVIAKIYKKIKVIEQKLIKLDVQITEKTDERRAANGELLSATSAFNKRVEGYLKRVELNDDSDRIVKYSHMANTIIDEYKIRLQKSKISIVADTMTLCYKKLANKKNLIDRIEMDPVTLDLKYLNVEGDEVNKASLSAGEKQLMVISVLWSLALCSKKKLPVIIDTPLSRLDSVHRVSLIKTYFPQASEQTIILSIVLLEEEKAWGISKMTKKE